MSAPTRFQPLARAPTDTAAGVLQRKCACGNGASALSGECEECQQKKALSLQARLEVSAANDPLEQEADRAATQVLNMPAPPAAPLRSKADTTTPALVSRRPTPATGSVRRAPASVGATLRSPGEALSPSARAFFEPRFGHDFSRVRVHRDAPAAASAREVAAHAYTVGHHLVFASGRYAPDSASGRALLAHELAHVIQQRAAVQRSSVSPEPETRRNPSDTDDEDERALTEAPVAGEPLATAPVPDEAATEKPPGEAPLTEDADEHEAGGVGGVLQRQAASELPEGGWQEKDEAAEIRAQAAAAHECVHATPADPTECDPARALSWADFSASPPRRHRFDALTHSSLRPRAINTALLRCMPDSAVAAGASSRAVQAFFNPARSWVKPAFSNPTNPASNSCRRQVARCQAHFTRLTRRGQTGNFALSTTANRGCPASAIPRGDQATSHAECATVVAADCRDRAVAESARLLAHERGHFNLSCAMATKANGMLAATPDFDALLRAARTTLARQQSLYDGQTNHGCNASRQAAWEAAIAAGLPAVTITIPAPRRVRRGRARRGRR
ncbi:DUF4157 domain-containing protein [Halomonas sp. HK25]|uniref:eCIS core domain-containing protein n=1 Tax=Halomonas sp. HK25 TaxID=3394321 RepID=UPI0039FD6474